MEFLEKINFDWKIAITITVLIVGALVLTKFLRWLIDKSMVHADPSNVEATRYRFFKNAVSFVVWLIAIATIISLIPKLKSLAVTLFAGAGILVAIIGFAAQAAFSNIISGIFIVIFKPFRVGDLIRVGNDAYGVVSDITLRHTVIKDFENKHIIIPNTLISSEVIVNDSIEDTRVCRYIEVGISYDSDVDLATKILQEEALKHKSCIDNRTQKQIDNNDPIVDVRLMSFGDFSVNLRAYVWTNDPFNAVKMHAEINKEFKKRFDAEGIEIPFPYRTLVYKNDLPKNAKSEDS